MSPFRNAILCVALCLLVPLATNCSDSSAPGSGNGGNDTGNDTAADLPDDQGGTDQGDDQGGSDVVQDPGIDPGVDQGQPDFGVGDCEIDSSGLTNPSDYYEDDGTTARDPRIRIEWVDFINNRVGVRNIGTETIEFDATWNFNINAITRFDLANARDLAPGELLRIHVSASGLAGPNDVYLNQPNSGNLRSCGGEIVILQLPAAGGTVEFSNHPSYVEAFIMWGTRDPDTNGDTFNDEAVTAGAWALSFTGGDPYRIETCYIKDSEEYSASFCNPFPQCDTHNTQGLFAVGDVTDIDDWYQGEADDAVCFQ